MHGFALLIHVGIVIILQFDGSLRPPRDPGYATLPARMATCSSRLAFCFDKLSVSSAAPPDLNVTEGREPAKASALLPDAAILATFDNQSTQKQHQQLFSDFVGGRLLPLRMDMTSAHAEYEGLLLGLEMLLELQSGGSSTNPTPSNWENQPSLLKPPQPTGTSNCKTDDAVLIIQGDCKTVIDQLSGRSLSRKLRQCYEVALERIRLLQQDCATKQVGSEESGKSTFRIRQVRFQHIPRQQNIVCDAICGVLMSQICSIAEQSLRRSLKRQLQKQQCAHSVPPEEDPHTLSVSFLLFQYFSTESSLIRYSVRPGLYRSLAFLALKRMEWDALYEIGHLVISDAKAIWVPTKKPQNANQGNDAQQMMLKFGIQCRLVALERMERHKEASKLRRKNRFLLQPTQGIMKSASTQSSVELSTIIDNLSEWDAFVWDWINLDGTIPETHYMNESDSSNLAKSIPQAQAWLDEARRSQWHDSHDQEQRDGQREAKNTLWISTWHQC